MTYYINDPELEAQFGVNDPPTITNGRLAFYGDSLSSNILYRIHIYLAQKLAGEGDHGRLPHFQQLIGSIALNLNNPGALSAATALSLASANNFTHIIPGKGNRYFELIRSLSVIDYNELHFQYKIYQEHMSDSEVLEDVPAPLKQAFDSIKRSIMSRVAQPPRSRSNSPEGFELIYSVK